MISDRIEEQVASELEYRIKHQALAMYADQLGEAISEDGLGQLARLLRDGTDADVRCELARIYDFYWERQLRRALYQQQAFKRRSHQSEGTP